MSLLLVAVISILGIILGKLLFKKWFNHLILYCFIFGGSLFLYELKLLSYPEIIPLAWFVIISFFFSFLFGILTIIGARNLNKENSTFVKKSDISLKIFIDGGKTLKYFLIFFSLISLYSAIEYWMILIKQFGSIPAVLLSGRIIYRMNVDGEIIGATPYIFLVGFAAVFFAGIYAAFKGRFTVLSVVPLISIMIKDIAVAGRATMTIALMEYIFTFFLFRYLLKNDLSERFKFSRKNAVVVSILIISFFIAGASLVRISRGIDETEKFTSGSSRELRGTKENLIISPSVYLYASSSIGVLNKYLASKGEDTKFGHHTFQSVYLLLTKFNVIKKPDVFQRGYYVPMWSNNGTFIRELHADFGIAGVFLVPFLLGLLITWLWFKFYEEKSLIAFAFLVHFYLIVGFSYLLMVTRFYYWTIGLSIILISIPVIEKIASVVHRKSL